MDNFLEYVEKYKFAIVGTVLIHVLAFSCSNFATLKNAYAGFEEDAEQEVLLSLDDIVLDPEIMELLELNKKPQEEENIANLAVDANDNRERSYDNFSTQKMDEQVEKDAKDLEQEYKDFWKDQHPDKGINADIEIDKNDPDKNDNSGEKNEPNGENAYAGSVMVSYNLEGRKKHKLPRPGYTCNSSGTVVIDIKVDKTGAIKSATLNTGLTKGADQCMINKAVKYAKMSSFNYSNSSPGSQSGTITYKFVSK